MDCLPFVMRQERNWSAPLERPFAASTPKSLAMMASSRFTRASMKSRSCAVPSPPGIGSSKALPMKSEFRGSESGVKAIHFHKATFPIKSVLSKMPYNKSASVMKNIFLPCQYRNSLRDLRFVFIVSGFPLLAESKKEREVRKREKCEEKKERKKGRKKERMILLTK